MKFARLQSVLNVILNYICQYSLFITYIEIYSTLYLQQKQGVGRGDNMIDHALQICIYNRKFEKKV